MYRKLNIDGPVTSWEESTIDGLKERYSGSQDMLNALEGDRQRDNTNTFLGYLSASSECDGEDRVNCGRLSKAVRSVHNPGGVFSSISVLSTTCDKGQ
ncbi:hypothetical protein RB195_015222 [Necator americanus]|uniref:Uncharacterized protein n=1 Tax=Necator americanus TaxID=51031 RepID=A0ABR1E3K5_NECAM